MAVYRLDDGLWFPSPYNGERNGLVAVGGDLSPERLLLAYSNGFFPWYSYKNKKEPYWYCPLDRFVIFPSEIHVSHSMKQVFNQHRFEVTFNQCFERVMEECAEVDGRNLEYGAWIGPDMIKAYTRLHHYGFAASVEVWEPSAYAEGEKDLVGGLYGVVIGNAFFGESMFSHVANGSKIALITLARHLEKQDCCFIDCQFETRHLLSMGGRHIPYDEYVDLIDMEKRLHF